MKRLRQLHRTPEGDRGAALVLVLIIITVVSLGGGALLSLSDASIRSTVALRAQAATAYAADGAAQVAISKVKDGTFDCSTTTPTVLTLGSATTPFYTLSQSPAGPLNASTICSPDPVAGASTTTTTTTGSGTTVSGTAGNLPSYALLAMGGPTATDFGIDFSNSAANKKICIENGSVVSNTKINATGDSLGVRLAGTGTADCTTGSNVGLSVKAAATNGCLPVSGTAFAPTPCTLLAPQIGLPTAPEPTDPITRTNVAAKCLSSGSATYAAFLPGKYTNVALLNSPCSGAADFEWFSPGTYYFDFGSTSWTWPTTLIAGTPTDSSSNPIAVNASNASSLSALAGIAPFPTAAGQKPNSCADPALQLSSPGAEFVFGGASTFTPNSSSNGNAEICATYSPNSPPIAIYGAQTALNVTGGSVSPQTLCTAAGCTKSLIVTASNGHAQFYVKGFVYAPNALIDLTLKNSLGQLFNWGVIVRNFNLTVNGVSPSAAFIQLPSANQGVTTTTTTTYTIRYISVWTCVAGASPCPQTGTPNVRVKVQTNGTSVKVLSWSVQR